MFTKEEIARYYELSEVHYRLFWNLERSRSLHYGLWDQNTPSFHEALLNTNRVLAERAAIKVGDRVLDAGCGVGGSSLWLAGERGCNVTGITLSAKQVQKAQAFAQDAGLSEKAGFEVKDYTATGYPDESFDVIWAVESVCHAADKSLFLKEAYRLLKKGGRLVMADFFSKKGLQGNDAAQVRAFAQSWAVNHFAVWEEFDSQLGRTGFHHIHCTNESKAVMPSAKRLYKAYLLGKPAAVLYRIFRGKPTSLAGNNVESARLQYVTLKRGLWEYRIVKAEK